ncbi:hypothetical protein F5I97DRAFT_966778 [Phlebopus sp. FC_14]|nr:hypothetical protein F5I97DRAFT_966778 [Phlebopus sp. FC_14]
MAQSDFLYGLFLLPAFFTIELTRAAFWSSRVTLDGPFSVVALLLSAFAITPVWTLVSWITMVVWLPVRVLLWSYGIGRGGPKKHSAAATARYYESRRRRVRESAEQSRR